MSEFFEFKAIVDLMVWKILKIYIKCLKWLNLQIYYFSPIKERTIVRYQKQKVQNILVPPKHAIIKEMNNGYQIMFPKGNIITILRLLLILINK